MTPSRAALELADAIVDIVCDSDRGWTRMDIARLIDEKVGPLVECAENADHIARREANLDAWRPGGEAKP